MANVDEFSRTLIEEAKRFYEKALGETDQEGKTAYLHGALVLGFCAFEAYINAIADDFLDNQTLPIHEKAILSEKDVILENGAFGLSNQLKMYRLEDRIQFLYRRFSGNPFDKDSLWWNNLKAGINTRNKLTHPKEMIPIPESMVKNSIQSIIDALDTLYKAIYNREYPPARRGLHSTMSF